MAPRDERVHSENESNRYQSADYQEHKRPRVKGRARQFGHQSPHPEGPSYGRDSGRSHSSVDNKPYRQNSVARKSARNGSQSSRYGRRRSRDPIKSKAIEKLYHTQQEPVHLNTSPLGKSSPGGLSLSRHNMHQVDTRSNGIEVDRYPKNDQTQRKRVDYSNVGKNNRIRNSMDGQTQGRMGNTNPRILALETRTRESASGDSDHHQRSRPPMPTDRTDPTEQYCLIKPIVKTEPTPFRLNCTPGTSIEYQSHSSQGCNPTENQSRIPSTPIQPELGSFRQCQNPPRLSLAAPDSHNGFNNHPMDPTSHGRQSNETEIITPISTSAMSISSGSYPSQPSSSSRKNPHHRRFNFCIKCKKPGTPIDILICCTECRVYYHTSCHEPKPSLNRQGRVNGVETWKCQRCIIRPRQPSDVSNSMGKSSNPALSEISSASSENSTTQISQGIVELTLHNRKSELNGNLPVQDINVYQEEVHFDSDVSHPRKRPKRNIRTQNHCNGTLGSTTVDVSGKISEESEYEEPLRPSNIFPGNRKIAVLIGNRSWGPPTAANERNNNQDISNFPETHTTVEDSQEAIGWISEVPSLISARRPQPTVPYQGKRIITSPDNETPPNRSRHTLPLEIKDSQENEEELTDASMILDSSDVYSPVQEEHNMCNHINRDSLTSLWETTETQWRLPEDRSYVGYGKSLSRYIPETSLGKNSPHYSPSVGDCGKDENEPIEREHRDMSSPPYSPPPAPEPLDSPCVSLPQAVPQEREPVNEDGFYCQGCTFYVADNGQYKDKLCGSCVIKTPARRNNHTTSASPQKLPQEIAGPTQSPASTQKLFWASRYRQQHPSASKSAPPRIPDSPEIPTTGNSGEASKGSSPREVPLVNVVPPVKKFQTSKDRVIERYQMKLIGPPEPIAKPKTRVPIIQNKRKREEPIKPFPEPHTDVNEILDKKGKGKAVAENEDSRKPVKSSHLTGPARKFPGVPAPASISPPPRSSVDTNVDRPMARGDSAPPRKTERRGPAMKSAGKPIRVIHISDSDDSEKDGDRLEELERRLQEQKGYTKKQVGKVIKLEKQLIEAERERREIQEKLDIALAANKKISGPTSPKRICKIKKLKRPIQVDRKGETETYDQPVQVSAESCAIEPKKVSTLKEFYKGYDFTSSVPWFCPPEIHTPDPSTFRKPGWRKPQERAPGYDSERKMKVHLHRQLTRDNRQPPKIMAEPFLDFSSPHLGNSRSASLDDEFSDEIYWALGGRETTIDEFMGFPDNMVPAVKDGILGFRPGIINQRTRRLDRNVQHYRIRAPGVLMDRI